MQMQVMQICTICTIDDEYKNRQIVNLLAILLCVPSFTLTEMVGFLKALSRTDNRRDAPRSRPIWILWSSEAVYCRDHLQGKIGIAAQLHIVRWGPHRRV
jgi:hypothetical protein